jgi:hypothetical protein
MKAQEFLAQVGNLTGYRWSVQNGSVVGTALNGKARGQVFNPVTALARTRRLTTQPNTARGTARAAKSLGLANSVVSHLTSENNRGYAQILRGQLAEATGV